MSAFWSWWIIGLIVFNLGIVSFLLLWGTRIEIPTQEDGTTGHAWAHGVLREAVRKLPLWWYVMSVSSLLFGVYYLYTYPGFGAYEGSTGWTSEKQHEQSVEQNNQQYSLVLEQVRNSSVEQLAANQKITRIGGVLFDDNCSACHGKAADGNSVIGAPDLLNDIWTYGGSEEAILHSIAKGRQGFMPHWKHLGIGAVKNLAHYVRSLSDLAHGTTEATVARADYEKYCAACHGVEGKGNIVLGAPDLTDTEWLYGSELEDIKHSIAEGRQGVMPAWEGRLSAEQIKMLMAWMRSERK